MLRHAALTLLLLTWSPPAEACIWDSDTLLQERSRFPTALKLMTGKFIRHTPDFYQWRIRDRTAKLAANPDDLGLIDDIAAAHDKLGDHAAAIAAMEAILPRDPRRYETLANLGTFYLHAGDFTKGIEFIDRALEVNPDAHFGRERYQRWLAEYVLTIRGEDGPIPLPLSARAEGGFATFVTRKRGLRRISPADVEPAVRGVLGMMRFGKHDSPILLEALGDLLSAPVGKTDAKLLAARAYLLAADAAADPAARAAYEALAERSLREQRSSTGTDTSITLTEVKEALTKERAEADAWYANFSAREAAWIRDGVDPETQIREIYSSEVRITGDQPASARPRPRPLPSQRAGTDPLDPQRAWMWPFVGLVGLGGLIALVIGARASRRPRQGPPS